MHLKIYLLENKYYRKSKRFIIQIIFLLFLVSTSFALEQKKGGVDLRKALKNRTFINLFIFSVFKKNNV